MAVVAFTHRFKEGAPQAHASALSSFPEGTDDHMAFVTAAVNATREMFQEGYGYKKAGVVITKLISKAHMSGSVFADTKEEERSRKLSSAMDAVNSVYGDGTLRFGVQGDGVIWSSREYQSPHYTTKWEDIPTVSVK
jgi:DNA polymerase V